MRRRIIPSVVLLKRDAVSLGVRVTDNARELHVVGRVVVSDTNKDSITADIFMNVVLLMQVQQGITKF